MTKHTPTEYRIYALVRFLTFWLGVATLLVLAIFLVEILFLWVLMASFFWGNLSLWNLIMQNVYADNVIVCVLIANAGIYLLSRFARRMIRWYLSS